MITDYHLIYKFVKSFSILNELCDVEVHPELQSGRSKNGVRYWTPRKSTTPAGALKSLYMNLNLTGEHAARLPPLFENLLLTYRWDTVELGDYCLLPNLPGPGLAFFLETLRSDKYLFCTLFANGYLRFGKGADTNYDPVCFDFRKRQKNGDCEIVQLDYEAALRGRICVKNILAPSLRVLMLDTIQRAHLKIDG